MTSTAASTFAAGEVLLPRTGHAPGELLWGEPPRRQPIAPLVLMAVLVLLVAAPSALGGGGGSANPVVLMRQVADSTYALTGLMAESNRSLRAIDRNSSNLVKLQSNMAGIAKATSSMEARTTELNETLAGVGASVGTSRSRLAGVDGKLGDTAAGMGALRRHVGGSAASTRRIVNEFGQIESAITSMDSNLEVAIGEMARSQPITKAFANNRTRLAVAGGDPTRYDVPNLAPDNRVMGIVLPMIAVMQQGGPLPARKDRHEASNFIVNAALRRQVPDGTNVVALVRPFDGFYGLPGEQFFVQNRIHGF